VKDDPATGGVFVCRRKKTRTSVQPASQREGVH
jgi:hypothetical protein